MKPKKNILAPDYPVEYYGGRHKHKILDEHLGRGNVYALIRTLYNQVEDFSKTHAEYLEALESIRPILGPESDHTIKKLMVAIDMKCSAILYWSGVEGLKMNYQHFENPLTPNCTWPNIDFDDYLRIGLSSSMPMYEAADYYVEKIRKSLPAEISEVWEAITSYEVSLELYGMKLAHYYGYLVGNDLLRHCVPGYQPDVALDFTYARLLENYFGKPVRDDEWEGVYRLSDWVTANIELSDPQSDAVLQEEILMRK